MLGPGEYADILRAIGWTIDQRLEGHDADRIEVSARGVSLLVAWEGAAGSGRERYGPTLIEKLREQAHALREGRASGPAGDQTEALRTIGQQLDEQHIVLERLVKLPRGHHLVGTLNSRAFGSWFEPEALRDMSAERRKLRSGPKNVAATTLALGMPMEIIEEHVQSLTASGRHVSVLWQEPGSLAFVARGRPYRSEFHIDPSDEMMYTIRGELRLHYRTPDGREEVTVLPQGSVIHTPAGIPHSPHFGPDAFLLVLERPRAEGEIDRFQWFCPRCDAFLHEEQFVVDDYRADPVSAAYRNFYDSEDFRTCKQCGTVMPRPDAI